MAKKYTTDEIEVGGHMLDASMMTTLNTVTSNHSNYLTSLPSHSHSWSSITGKPSTFTPSSHNHDDRYYTETESDARFVNVTGGTMTGRLIIDTDVAGDGGWDDAGILLRNDGSPTGEVSIAFDNEGTGTSYWIQGLNQSETLKWAYGGSFTDGNQKMQLTSSGDLTTSGTITASNFSGTSSGTNTGDQDLSGYALTSHNHDDRYYTESEVDAITHQWEWRWQRWDGYLAPASESAADWTSFYKAYFTERTESTDASNPPQDNGYINTKTGVGVEGGFGGSSWGNIFGNLSLYHALIYTNIYVDKEFTVNVTTFNGDDAHAIFIDGKFVRGSIPCCTNKSYSYTFEQGWHRIDLIYSEGGGGDYITMGWNPKDYTDNISQMHPHLGSENPNYILNKLKEIDGADSGLDADTLDGQHASDFATSSHNHDGTYLPLTAGSSHSLTGDLYIEGADKALRINNGAQPVVYLGDGGANTDGQLILYNSSGDVNIVLNGDNQNHYITNGNVGIGVVPADRNVLDIRSDDTNGVFVTHRNNEGFFLNRTYADYNNDGNTVEYQERIGVDGNRSSIGNFSNHTLGIRTNNQDRITVLAGGNVGINKTNPEAKLDVRPDNNNGKVLRVGNYSVSTYFYNTQADATIDLTCGSYYQAEVIITANQTNGGDYNNIYIRGIWSNNHESHHWDEIESIGFLGGSSIEITVGQNTVSNSGKLSIDFNYTSQSFSALNIKVTDFYNSHSYSIS